MENSRMRETGTK